MDKEILNLEEACDFLGVGERTLIKMLREEHLPARKIGREWRFSKSALTNWIASGDSYEYTNKEEKYEVIEDINSSYDIVLNNIFNNISTLKTNRDIHSLLKAVPEDINIPDDITLRISYKQKREIEKLEFKLFWPLRSEFNLLSKEK